MSVTISSDDVEAVLGENYNTAGDTEGPSLTAFIGAASDLLDWIVSQDTASVLSEGLQERIGVWLAAHFYAHSDRMLQSEQTDQAAGTYVGKTGIGLRSTQYGQAAITLDLTGALARKADSEESGKATKKVSLFCLGTPT